MLEIIRFVSYAYLLISSTLLYYLQEKRCQMKDEVSLYYVIYTNKIYKYKCFKDYILYKMYWISLEIYQ